MDLADEMSFSCQINVHKQGLSSVLDTLIYSINLLKADPSAMLIRQRKFAQRKNKGMDLKALHGEA